MPAEANAAIETVSVQDLPYHIEDSEAVLVDVRETVERERDGTTPGALHMPRGLARGAKELNPRDGAPALPVRRLNAR